MSRKGKKVGFDVGDAVMARWPGSKLWYEAVVLSTNYEEDVFQIRFPDGQENEVPYSHIAKPSRFRARSSSPSRKRKTSPGRRRRSRSKSPSRKKEISPKIQSLIRSPGRPKPVSSQKKLTASDLDEKPSVNDGTTTITTEDKDISKLYIGKQFEPIVTRSALKQLEKHGVDAQGLLKGLGEELSEREPHVKPGYAFGGPIGVFILMVFLPCVLFGTYLYCYERKCYYIAGILLNPKKKLPSMIEFLDPRAAGLVYGWVLFQAFLSILPLGKVVEGRPLHNGSRLKYRLNGLYALFISVATFWAGFYFKLPIAQFIRDKFLALMTHALLLSLAVSIYLLIKSSIENTGLSTLGNTGNLIYDFFMGRQLNPRIGNLDLKFFCEMRPGLIAVVIIDFSIMLYSQMDSEKINGTLLLFCIFHFIYVADALWFEAAILSSPDITTEGFGFMFAFGGLVWVPFIFSLQSRYIAQQNYTISPYLVVFVCILNTIGFVVYRVANLQKDLFRRNSNHPAVEHLESMVTNVPGYRLLITGWWGYVRHPNYLGDIIMAIAWSLTCGFSHFVPYVYPVYLTIRLLYRIYRFEALCRVKYGASWDEYCLRVPYRLIPNIF
ncbi:LOW QUALITY PROTEIN: delta(14)-sterol reductase TM7SF2-like [Xenia sp. Carnegie-2017]|uniref:LOW QUALITY PROTEIN: delta(14)-sterol reductase TM7SF2-like n=1 Tax=Xenia sp. Carnegie-2017 TaxID=2897299 RepID=UPI001F03EE7B|nr:LOW QUALITY PROTEIN: delta(14)-sterol reductase TM7SF2-like [Xenia sp. Carnegie-2017]